MITEEKLYIAERQLYIAKELLKDVIRNRKLRDLENTNDFLSECGTLSKRTGIPREEIAELGKTIKHEALEEAGEKVEAMKFKE